MGEVEIRRATPDDRGSILSLLQISLGWTDDPRYDELFRWKHNENPFGPSPAWIALDGDRVVGFRTFMRWEFELDGEVVQAARAVDTATHPDHQGRGVFRRLTLHALDELQSEDVAFIFNTPNDQSRPGYLKMGWQGVGRLPVRVRARNLSMLPTIARARKPADVFSPELGGLPGVPAGDVFGETYAVTELLDNMPTTKGLTTRRTPTYLAWRYGLPSLAYRAVLVGKDIAEGLVVFRVRRRARSLEVALADVLVARGRTVPRRLVRSVIAGCRADYALALSTDRRLPMARVPGVGPRLVWRELRCPETAPAPGDWHLSLGDVELF